MLPEHLSVSQITTWLGCPRKYRFRYVERRPAERRSVHLAFGIAVHSAIEWWFRERMDGRKPAQEDAQRIFRADWTAQTTDELLDYEGKEPAALRSMGEGLLGLFTSRFETDALPHGVEQRFEVQLRHPFGGYELPLPLVGFLDYTKDGLLGELKTCARKCGPSQWSLQLSAYSYAFQELYGRRPRIQLVELIKTKQPKIEVLDISMAIRDEAWFVEVAAEVYQAIRAGTFPPIPSWMCTRCEYRRACRG